MELSISDIPVKPKEEVSVTDERVIMTMAPVSVPAPEKVKSSANTSQPSKMPCALLSACGSRNDLFLKIAAGVSAVGLLVVLLED